MNKTMYPNVLSSRSLCKDHVKNAAGENLGKVEDLMIDLHSGRIAYRFCRLAAFSRWVISYLLYRGKR